MDIYIYVFQCDLKDTKNKEIMDTFQAELRTVDKSWTHDDDEIHLCGEFKMHEVCKVLKMTRIAQDRFTNDNDYVSVSVEIRGINSSTLLD